MKFIELFAGIGGFRLGLERTGHECVFSNEWLEKPRRIYKNNFGEEPDGRDIELIQGGELPKADLIVGGFPCATFSVAGKRAGFNLSDTRGTLCFEMFRIAQQRGIPYIMFENVKGLLNHDSGRTFAIILSALDEMGYDSQWELLDSQYFGVPQRRERIFLIANLRGKPRPKVFPIGQAERKDMQDSGFKKDQIARTLEASMRKGIGNTEGRILARVIKDSGQRVKNIEDISQTLINNDPELEKIKKYETNEDVILLQNHHEDRTVRQFKNISPTMMARWGTGGGNVPFVRATITPDRVNKRQNGRRFKEHNEPAFTLGAQDRHGVRIDYGDNTTIRKLTPLECERLQGLPDNFTKYYDNGSLVSNGERYERCGRTVTIPVIEAIGERLYDFY
jgi:DNA (cytosine-5)-methyltransferase 1